jgi:hypothetical protein
MAEQLVETTCGVCDQTDDHPKHVFYLGDGESRRHMDCCAPLGCDLCAKQISGADGLQGSELREHLVTKES